MRSASSTIEMGKSTVPLKTDNTPNDSRRCYTTKKMLNFDYTWTIENFRLELEEIGTGLESSTFSFSYDNNDLEWCLQMRTYSENQEGNNISLQLLLVSTSKPESTVRARVKFSIINDQGREALTATSKSYSYREGTKSEFKKFVTTGTILHDPNRILPNNSLVILCVISIVEDSVSISGCNKDISSKVPDCSILEDLNKVYVNQKFADVTISTPDHEFKVHKVILAARSTVFEAMFENNMEESQKNHIEIKDVEPEVLGEMLRFIYTGNVNNISNTAADLLAVADKYALDRLKIMCEEELGKGITIETAAQILMLADLYRAGHLKSQAMDFFNKHAVQVLETEGFKQMENSQQRYLIVDAFRSLAIQQIPSIKENKACTCIKSDISRTKQSIFSINTP